ncbi:TetR family transcriptional regulator [Sphingomonas adhaesiva]|uniref:TetR family transcriptional regulator n=1 Tax=Sphingomonas adhaesiva TaxID=28212 RepID=UPI002FF44AD5
MPISATRKKKNVMARPAGAAGRDHLLEAASSLLSEQASDISLSDIAERSGMNSAMVSYYFGSKQGLLAALLERDLVTALSQLDRLLASPGTPTQKMERNIDGLVRLFFRYPYLARLMTDLAHHGEEQTRQYLADTYLRRIFDAYEVLITEGVKAGEFVETDPKLFYFGVVGACDLIFSTSFVMKYVHGIDRIDEDMRALYARQVQSLLLNGLRRRPDAT